MLLKNHFVYTDFVLTYIDTQSKELEHIIYNLCYSMTGHYIIPNTLAWAPTEYNPAPILTLAFRPKTSFASQRFLVRLNWLFELISLQCYILNPSLLPYRVVGKSDPRGKRCTIQVFSLIFYAHVVPICRSRSTIYLILWTGSPYKRCMLISPYAKRSVYLFSLGNAQWLSQNICALSVIKMIFSCYV